MDNDGLAERLHDELLDYPEILSKVPIHPTCRLGDRMIVQIYRRRDPLVLENVKHLPRIGEYIIVGVDTGYHKVVEIFHAFDNHDRQMKITLMVDPSLAN